MASDAEGKRTEEQLAELVRSLTREIRTGIVEGVVIIALGLSLFGWSIVARAADPVRQAPQAALWSSIPVVLLGVSYLVRSFADSRIRSKVKSILLSARRECSAPSAPSQRAGGNKRQ
jgi:hypothetical protein